MPFNHDLDRIADYANGVCYPAKDIAVKLYLDLKQHAKGDMPAKLIEIRRPGESDRIKEYRKDIYEPMTKTPITKVISSLSKIRRSSEWNIQFDNKTDSLVRKGEELEEYILNKYPRDFTSLTNWMFSVGLKEYLLDSNAVIAVLPLNWEVDVTEYYRPFPIIYNSTHVLDYVYNEYAVLLSGRTCTYTRYDQTGKVIGIGSDGKVIHIIDEIGYYTYQQVSAKAGEKPVLELTETREHGLGYMPAFKVPGVFYEVCQDSIINESRINGMLPDLNEAARIYSDLQAEIVQHVHSQMWLYMNTKCTHCNGSGYTTGLDEKPCACNSCRGSGLVPVSSYTNIVVEPPNMGEEAVPTPPAGYVQKTDVAEMCNTLDRLAKDHLYMALSSINMQFLDQTPITQSGIAKEVDRDELNNFVHSVAEDIVYMMDRIILITNDYRTKSLIEDDTRRNLLLPKIAVPEKYDILSANTLATEISEAKQQQLNSVVISAMETEYAARKFNTDPRIAQIVALAFELDPLSGLGEDDKIMRLQNGGVTQLDYIISSNLIPFIKRAIREIRGFSKLSTDSQYQKLVEYAVEKQQQITSAGRIASDLTTEEEQAETTENELIDEQ